MCVHAGIKCEHCIQVHLIQINNGADTERSGEVESPTHAWYDTPDLWSVICVHRERERLQVKGRSHFLAIRAGGVRLWVVGGVKDSGGLLVGASLEEKMMLCALIPV